MCSRFEAWVRPAWSQKGSVWDRHWLHGESDTNSLQGPPMEAELLMQVFSTFIPCSRKSPKILSRLESRGMRQKWITAVALFYCSKEEKEEKGLHSGGRSFKTAGAGRSYTFQCLVWDHSKLPMQCMRTSIRTFQYLVFKTANVQVEHFVVSCSISFKTAGAGGSYTFCLDRDFGAHKLYTFQCLFQDCAKLVVHQNTFRCLVFKIAGGASVSSRLVFFKQVYWLCTFQRLFKRAGAPEHLPMSCFQNC